MKSLWMIAICLLLTSSIAYAKKAVDLSSLNTSSYEGVITTSDITPKMALRMEKYSLVNEILLVAYVEGRQAMVEGETQRAELRIEDPASEISRQLGSLVGDRLQLPVTYFDSGLGTIDKGMNFKIRKANTLKEELGSKKLVINAATQAWSFGVFAKTKFRVLYMASASIVDTNTGETIGYSECVAPMKKASEARDAETILANDAVGLKEEIKDAVDFCVGVFKEKLLKPDRET